MIVDSNWWNIGPINALRQFIYPLDVGIEYPFLPDREGIIIEPNVPQLLVVSDNVKKMIETLDGIEGNVKFPQVRRTNKAFKLDERAIGEAQGLQKGTITKREVTQLLVSVKVQDL